MDLVGTEHDALHILFYNGGVSGGEVIDIPSFKQVFGSIVINDPERSLDDVSPMRTMATVIR